jgi:hypothetical protein
MTALLVHQSRDVRRKTRIHKAITVSESKGSKEVKALFGSGASESFIRANIAREFSSPARLPNPKTFEMGRGTLKVTRAMIGDVQLSGATLFATLLVVPNLTEELILGADFFQRWKIRLNPENEDVILDQDALKLKLV